MSDNGGNSAMVAIVAILVIIALGFIVLRLVPGASDGAMGSSDIQVDLNPADGQ